MASEKFNLKWNDFQSNVSKSFGLFRNESYLHDVTLVSEDFKHVPAHKLVLSASSEFFRNILQQTKQTQPLMCLEGVSSSDLQNVLDYVYDGEVKIHQEDLDKFLSIAQKLKLEGQIRNSEYEQDVASNELDVASNELDVASNEPNDAMSKPEEQSFDFKTNCRKTFLNKVQSQKPSQRKVLAAIPKKVMLRQSPS